jgi:hypothetical protein
VSFSQLNLSVYRVTHGWSTAPGAPEHDCRHGEGDSGRCPAPRLSTWVHVALGVPAEPDPTGPEAVIAIANAMRYSGAMRKRKKKPSKGGLWYTDEAEKRIAQAREREEARWAKLAGPVTVRNMDDEK